MPEYAIFTRASSSSENGVANHPAYAFEAMTKYNEELNSAGVLLSGDALAPTSESYIVKFDGSGNADASKGPFDVASENHVTGWWIIKAGDSDEALKWAKKAPIPGGEVFVHRIAAPSEYGSGYTTEIKERDSKVRKEASQRARN